MKIQINTPKNSYETWEIRVNGHLHAVIINTGLGGIIQQHDGKVSNHHDVDELFAEVVRDLAHGIGESVDVYKWVQELQLADDGESFDFGLAVAA